MAVILPEAMNPKKECIAVPTDCEQMAMMEPKGTYEGINQAKDNKFAETSCSRCDYRTEDWFFRTL